MLGKCHVILGLIFWGIPRNEGIKRLNTHCNVMDYPFYLYMEMIKDDNTTHFCGATLLTEASALTTIRCCRTMNERRNTVYRGYRINTGNYIEKRDVLPMPMMHGYQNYCIIKFLPFNITRSSFVRLAESYIVSDILRVKNVCNTVPVWLVGQSKQRASFFDGFHCITREIRPRESCRADMRNNPVFSYDENVIFCHYHSRINDKSCKTIAGSPIMFKNMQVGIEIEFLENGEQTCLNNFSLAIRTDLATKWVEGHKKRMEMILRENDANISKLRANLVIMNLLLLSFRILY